MSNEQKSIWDNESATQAQPAQTQPAQTPREVTVSLDDVEDITDNRK